MKILGFFDGHDAGACLVENGKVTYAINEERLSRVKLHLGFPYRSVKKIFKLAKVSPKEIDYIAIPRDLNWLNLTDIIRAVQKDQTPYDFNKSFPLWLKIYTVLSANEFNSLLLKPLLIFKTIDRVIGKKIYLNAISSMGLDPKKVVFVNHHLAHAASAYYASGVDNCLAITLDGKGDHESGSVYICEDGKMTRVAENPIKYSVGGFYTLITAALGFKMSRHEGKVTGLAAFGDPKKIYSKLSWCLSLAPSKESFFINISKFPNIQKFQWQRLWKYFGLEYAYYVLVQRDYFNQIAKKYSREDVAAAAQKILEERVVAHIEEVCKKYQNDKVVLAGGVFANVKLNQKILEIPQLKFMYIHPHMGDGGACVGAALAIYWERQKDHKKYQPSISKMDNVYLGQSYTDQEIEEILKKEKLNYKKFKNVEKEIAKLVSQRYIVGRFNGRMEYGPRALGNRTIIADARDASINDTLNKRLHRTEFMPFAPNIMYEKADLYLKNFQKGIWPAKFMTVTFEATRLAKKSVPAVVHVDGTARPQLVDKQTNLSFHKILNEYAKITGLYIVINTSFNMHEEPIVESPKDAIRAFHDGAIDVLAIGNFLVYSESYKKVN